MFLWRNKKNIMWIPLLSVAMIFVRTYFLAFSSVSDLEQYRLFSAFQLLCKEKSCMPVNRKPCHCLMISSNIMHTEINN